jgi:hypothetical protein
MENAKPDKETTGKVTIVKNMRDYSNDPFVVRKREMAIAFIKKNGFPPGPKKKKQK